MAAGAGGKKQKFTYKSNRRNQERREPHNPRGAKRAKAVEWDDTARQDYLTGFSKRKQERKEVGRKKAEEAARLERNELRAQVREQLKQRAADNVRAAHERYGDPVGAEDADDLEEDDGEEDDEDEEDEEDYGHPGEHAFDTDEAHTTVTVQPFDVDDDQDPAPPQPPAQPSGSSKGKQRQRQPQAKKFNNNNKRR